MSLLQCPMLEADDRLPQESPLAAAVNRFNEVFGYHLRLPMCQEDLEMAAELAALRGRQDIAQELLSFLADESAGGGPAPVPTPPQE